MKKTGWRDAKVSTFGNIPAGAYVCEIKSATDVPGREYLLVEYDVAEGDFAGYFGERAEQWGSWPSSGKMYWSYKQSALGMFKARIQAVEKSSAGYVFNDDENTLVGKRVGLVLCEEEYRNNSGDISVRIKAYRAVPVEDVPKTAAPAARRLKEESKPPVGGFTEVDDDGDLPF